MRLLGLGLALLGFGGLAPAFFAQSTSLPAPQIQNGRVEVRTGAAIDREIAAVSGSGVPEAVWVAWKVPMIDGDRDLCNWYSDPTGTVRGIYIGDEPVQAADGTRVIPRPAVAPPTGPVALEAGTHLVVLARVISGDVERLRTVSDDCAMDAGGRTVYWLDRVTPAESVRYLGTFVTRAPRAGEAGDRERRLAQSATRAIGLHRDPAAVAALIGFARANPEAGIRREAMRALAQSRDPRAMAFIEEILKKQP